MKNLLDQSALTDLAERLVQAARQAGADAADAVAVRSVSLGVEIRDGALEESERSEGDDVGLRVFVGRKQAVVSTNDIGRADPKALAERAVAMAKVAPDDPYAGLADRGASFARLSRSRSDRSGNSGRRGTRGARARNRTRRPRGQGCVQVRRRVGVGGHRRHGAGHERRLSRRLSRVPAQPVDDRDCR